MTTLQDFQILKKKLCIEGLHTLLFQLGDGKSESAQQQAYFCWASLPHVREKYPQVELAYHIPNGGARDAPTAARLRSEGVKAGVPDIHLPVPVDITVYGISQVVSRYHSLYIEMKYGKNVQSPVQITWFDKLSEYDHACVVCWHWYEAAEATIDYLNGELDQWLIRNPARPLKISLPSANR